VLRRNEVWTLCVGCRLGAPDAPASGLRSTPERVEREDKCGCTIREPHAQPTLSQQPGEPALLPAHSWGLALGGDGDALSAYLRAGYFAERLSGSQPLLLSVA